MGGLIEGVPLKKGRMIGYQEFIEYVVKSIVAHPEDVRVEKIVDERGVLLMLHVNAEDIGYVIGKKGQTVTALRNLLRIVGSKHSARVTLKVNEPEGRERPLRTESGEEAPRPRKTDDIDTSVIDNLEI